MSWETYKLAEVVSFKTGKLNSNAAVVDGEFPFFTCAQETFQIDKYAFDTEAVLLAGNNANGVFALKHYNGRFNAYQRTYIIETLNPEKLNTRFLYFALRPALKRFESESIGATTQYLTKGILDNFKIKVPELSAQTRIAAILSAYDDLIENNRRRIALLEQAARLLYREWFVHFRFPGHETAKFVDGLPEGWEENQVSDLGAVVTGKTPSKRVAENFDGHIPFIKTPDMHGNIFVLATAETLTEQGAKSQEKKTLPPRSILVSCIGTVGVVTMNAGPAQFNQQINAVIAGEGNSNLYVFFALESIKPRLEAIGGGVTMANVSKTKFESVPVLIPHASKQSEFHEIVEPMFDQILQLAKTNQQLTKARDLLLPRLMDGRIPVKV